MSGTARIEPPPPTRPSENPTSIPDASPSAPCAVEIIKMKDSVAPRDHRRNFYGSPWLQHKAALQHRSGGYAGTPTVSGPVARPSSAIRVPLMVAISVSLP